jgi:hypothetical protein
MPNMNEKNGAIKGRNPISENCEPSFANPEVSEAAIWVEEDKWRSGKSYPGIVQGEVTDTGAKNVVINSNVNRVNGLVVYSGWNEYTLENSKIELGGYGCSDFTSRGAGALSTNTGILTIRDSEITTRGGGRCATICTSGSTLKVYNSKLSAFGGELPPNYKPVIGPGMMEPPYPLGLAGNARTHLSMDGSRSFFYNCDVYATAWGAFSTDASGGCLYLEVNDSRVTVAENGYGTYADNGCHNVFNRTSIKTGNMLAIQDGNSSITLNECTADCGGIGFLLHGGLPAYIDVGLIEINDSTIRSKKEVFLAKTTNVDLYVKGSTLESEQGVILRSMVTDDQIYYERGSRGPEVYGVQATFEAMTLNGDLVHDDTERKMCLSLVDTTLNGAVTGNPTLALYGASRWTATKDSAVTFVGTVNPSALDAAAGVTITATAGEGCQLSVGTTTLPSGGKLVVA